MSRWIRLCLCCAGALACLAFAAPGSAGAAAAARACAAPDYPGSGYFTSLKVKQVSCRKGREVTLAHYRCRVESGRAGRCGRRVLGNRCSERRNSIPTEINARVKCRKGDTRVIYTYQQNT